MIPYNNRIPQSTQEHCIDIKKSHRARGRNDAEWFSKMWRGRNAKLWPRTHTANVHDGQPQCKTLATNTHRKCTRWITAMRDFGHLNYLGLQSNYCSVRLFVSYAKCEHENVCAFLMMSRFCLCGAGASAKPNRQLNI